MATIVISYGTLTDAQRQTVLDLNQKLASLDQLAASIQTQVGDKLNAIATERANITAQLGKIVSATLTQV